MWHMIGSFHFWLRLLLGCLFCYGIYLLVWRLVTSIIASLRLWSDSIEKVIESPHERDELMAQIVPWKNAQARRATRNAGKTLAIAAVGFILGWSIHVRIARSQYEKDYAAWKERSTEYQRQYSLWLANQRRVDNGQ